MNAMAEKPGPNLSRRQALARLGLLPIAAYVGPAVLALSTAASASQASAPSAPSPPSRPSPPSTPSGPGGDGGEADELLSDDCQVDSSTLSGSGAPSISQDDFRRAQAAVDAGYALPLSQIWPKIIKNYPGRIISVTFTGHRTRPRYRLRAVSPSGRLETIIVSARTGAIERIVGC